MNSLFTAYSMNSLFAVVEEAVVEEAAVEEAVAGEALVEVAVVGTPPLGGSLCPFYYSFFQCCPGTRLNRLKHPGFSLQTAPFILGSS